MKSRIHHGSGTHAGCKRAHNEDCFVTDPELGLAVVADGMGGHQCGEVASRIVVDFIQERVGKGVLLREAVEQAHEIVLMAARQGLGLPGMGATVVALKLDGNDYEIAWVGDSRAYLWSEREQLRQLTRDHSLVQELLEAGQISAQEAAVHPYRNMITQAVGAADLEQLNPGYVCGSLYRGQQILLCSDGLTGEVSVQEISAILASAADEQHKVDQLIGKALDNGGSDNVTVVLVSAAEDAPVDSEITAPIAINVQTQGQLEQ